MIYNFVRYGISKVSFLFGLSVFTENQLGTLAHCDILCKRNGIYVGYMGVSKNKQYANINKLTMCENSNTTGYYGNCGEDALFLVKNDRYTVFGVADGVGGWKKKGIDPSAFSGNLVKFAAINASNALEECSYQESPSLEPLKIMSAAYCDLKEKTPQAYGSSTACFAVIDNFTNKLKIANLGDSGFILRRKGSSITESVEQCHYFNCPFQLTLPPPAFVTTSSTDKPQDAHIYEFDLQKDDFLIVGTDGVWDNIDTKDSGSLKDISTKYDLTSNDLSQLTKDFFSEIISNSKWDNCKVRCAENTKGGVFGGKNDDITLLVVGIINNESKI